MASITDSITDSITARDASRIVTLSLRSTFFLASSTGAELSNNRSVYIRPAIIMLKQLASIFVVMAFVPRHAVAFSSSGYGYSSSSSSSSSSSASSGACSAANSVRSVVSELASCGGAALSGGAAYGSDAACVAGACAAFSSGSLQHECKSAGVAGNFAGCATGDAGGCYETVRIPEQAPRYYIYSEHTTCLIIATGWGCV